MLEFFRRHRGAFLITLTIIIIVSFSFFGAWRFDKDAQVTVLPSDHAMTVYGKDYTIAEVSKVQRGLQFAMQHLGMFDLYIKLSGLGPKGDAMGGNMIGTVLTLQHVLAEAGIRASDQEATEELKKQRSLQGNNGQFDLAQGQRMEETAGSYGMTYTDILDVVRLKIGLDKLEELVGKNYSASAIASEKQYVSTQQVLKVSTIVFNTDDFKKDIKVTDEEIAKSFEETKESFKTTEKRAVKYVFFESIDQDKIPLEKREDAKITLEKREEAKKAVSDKINAFSDVVLKQGRAGNLEAIAKELKETVKSVPAFAQDTPPEDLKSEADLIKAIFEMTPKTQPVSDALKTEKGYYFFAVPTVEEPKQQELAAVKDKIKDSIIAKKAAEVRTKAVNDARDFILAGLKDKKKIDDLVKEKKLTLNTVADIPSASPPADVPNADKIAPAAAKTAVGQISQAVDFDKGTLLVYVKEKILYKSDSAAAMRKQQVDSLASKERDGLFNSWFSKKVEEARIVTPVRNAA